RLRGRGCGPAVGSCGVAPSWARGRAWGVGPPLWRASPRRGVRDGARAATCKSSLAGAVALRMSYMLPHLHNGWQVDQAILSEEDRVVVIRFGHDWDPTCMKMDEVLYSIAEKEQAHHD
uniref:Thioredoxin like 4A n=1 Tax=Equus asinus TaxID=9793 RepID=A0A9L0JL99_EQUAS